MLAGLHLGDPWDLARTISGRFTVNALANMAYATWGAQSEHISVEIFGTRIALPWRCPPPDYIVSAPAPPPPLTRSRSRWNTT